MFVYRYKSRKMSTREKARSYRKSSKTKNAFFSFLLLNVICELDVTEL